MALSAPLRWEKDRLPSVYWCSAGREEMGQQGKGLNSGPFLYDSDAVEAKP
jgi:hypothetical protein